MVKFIKLLILCSTFFLYCCKKNETDTVQLLNSSKETRNGLQKRNPRNIETVITLTDDEKRKFNSLKNAFNKVLLAPQYQLNKNRLNKCLNFLNWLYGKIPEQKEIANAFTIAYKFLDEKRKLKASNKDFDIYISDAINYQVNKIENSQGDDSGKYGYDGINTIYIFFKSTLEHISNEHSNETMLEHLKKDLSYYGSGNLFQLLQWKN
ncbi:Mlp family lipoprotein [Borrelia turicatae]|uniref:Mlp family lipoprotein n=1 Tax=Borrelia turicatae TaxID=142 RepID=UPI002ED507A8